MLVLITILLFALTGSSQGAKCDWDAGFNSIIRSVEKYIEENPKERPPLIAENGTGMAQSREMQFTMWITALPEVEVEQTRIVLSGGVELYIKAPEFNFNLTETCGVNRVEDGVDGTKFWWPAIFSPHVSEVNAVAVDQNRLYISLGTISLMPYNYAEMQIKCNFNPTHYPFETQVCETLFFVTGSGGVELNLLSGICYFWRYQDVNIAWDMLGCNAAVSNDLDYTRKVVKINLLLRRKPQYGFYAMIIPMMILIVTNPVIFVLPPQETSKIDVGVAFLLAFFIFMETMQTQLPATQQQPYLYFCILTVVAINAVAILVSGGLCIIKSADRAATMNKLSLILMIAAEITITFVTFMLLVTVPSPECSGEIGVGSGQLCEWEGEHFGTEWSDF